MFHNQVIRRSLPLLLLGSMSGCSCEGPDAEPSPPDMGQPQVAPSLRPRVQFKGQRRWGRDLAQGLELNRSELCLELGVYDCLEEVHLITLGGVDPYRLGVDAPLKVAPVTAPIAADRVALSACHTRATRDLEGSGRAVLFQEAVGREDLDPEALEAMSARLYRSVLGRPGRPEELEVLVDFWPEVQSAEDPTRAWTILSCFMVATSLESLFY